ncbi:hypothetical protein SCLCIDRAFT_30714 [Scleroderma citrinum Foug A]|uniref:Uncharacterized protein n=1 Tax=Scleroderma citrinum Foug A TaxID=1036808 RepID=A0A0C3D2G2_9AGAM|nr:hypothetical protein SCLCIDRAFT_30714 [Scleroderma citrinum Foug A]
MTSASLPDLEVASHWHMALCADCNSRRCSSVVFIVAPRLPQLPGFNSLHIDRIALTHARYEFYLSVLTAGHMDSIWTVWWISRWLRDSSTSQVQSSSCRIAASVYGPSSNPSKGFHMSEWRMHVLALIFILPRRRLRLTSLYGRSASQMGGLDNTVNAAAACCVITVTIITISIAIAIAVSIAIAILSPLAPNVWRNHLVSTLRLSECKCSAQCLNRCIPDTLGHRDFGHVHSFHLISNAMRVHIHA